MSNFIEKPLKEITLRRYETPFNLEKRDILKKICLSLGLLQPGDSRDIIVDILYVLETVKFLKKELTITEIKDELIDIRTKKGLSLDGTAESNLRRQIRRLRELYIVEKIKNRYRITEFMSLKDLFNEKILNIILKPIIQRNEDYFDYYFEHCEKRRLSESDSKKIGFKSENNIKINNETKVEENNEEK